MKAILLVTQGEGVGRSPAPEILIEGSGASRLWQCASFQGGNVTAGVWNGEPGKLKVRPRAHHEIFCVNEGLVELQETNGEILRVGPGESAYIPMGWQGIWNTVKPTAKHYVLIAARAPNE